MTSTARSFPIPYFTFKGGLVDPRLRASNEHILIVRVPRAGGRPGCPTPFFSSLLKYFSILTRVHPRLIGKTEGGTVGIAGVVEIDAIVPADGFHCRFEGNGLGV